MNTGGAETFLMKLYRCLDKEKYQFDFCINAKEKCFYEDEIIQSGGRIFRIPSKSENVKQFKKQLYSLIKTEGYEYVLRITSSAMGFMDIKIAKKAGAKVCAVRSSNSSDGGSLKAKLVHILGRFLYGRYVDVKIAPSDLAARYTFGDRDFDRGLVHILNNAIDLNKFRFDRESRANIRREFNIDSDTFVVGHIGRFMVQKNHKFLLKAFSKIREKNNNSVLLLVGGNGDLEGDVRGWIKELDLEENVIFAGVRSDIPAVLSAMDAFVLPSLYEGMPNVVIEAQATGLPCVIADTITREADITGLVDYLPLGDPDLWAEKVIEVGATDRADTRQIFIEKEYDIESTVNKFVKMCFGEC